MMHHHNSPPTSWQESSTVSDKSMADIWLSRCLGDVMNECVRSFETWYCILVAGSSGQRLDDGHGMRGVDLKLQSGGVWNNLLMVLSKQENDGCGWCGNDVDSWFWRPREETAATDISRCSDDQTDVSNFFSSDPCFFCSTSVSLFSKRVSQTCLIVSMRIDFGWFWSFGSIFLVAWPGLVGLKDWAIRIIPCIL